MVAMELKKLAFPNVENLNGDWSSLKVIEEVFNEGKTEGKKVVKVRQYDKLKALLMLCKMFGWNVRSQKKEASKAQANQLVIMDFGSGDQEKKNC